MINPLIDIAGTITATKKLLGYILRPSAEFQYNNAFNNIENLQTILASINSEGNELKRYGLCWDALTAISDPRILSTTGYSPLELAITFNDVNLVKLLLEYTRCSVTSQDPKPSQTALILASRFGRTEIVTLLLNDTCKDRKGLRSSAMTFPSHCSELREASFEASMNKHSETHALLNDRLALSAASTSLCLNHATPGFGESVNARSGQRTHLKDSPKL